MSIRLLTGANGSFRKNNRAMKRKVKWGLVMMELLEDRTLLSALNITGGALTYDGGSAASAVTVAASGTMDVFTDSDQTITLTAGAIVAGWTGSGTNTVTGPAASIASLAVGTSATSGQSLTIDFSGGDLLPASGVSYAPAAATGGAMNALTIEGSSFTSEAYTAIGAGAGTITYSDSAQSSVPIAFSNLSPVNDTVPSPSFIFNAPAGATTVNVNTGPVLGGAQTDQINDGGTGTFDLINFANKTAVTVNVNNAGASTTLNIPAIAAGLTTLNVNSGAGAETVNAQAIPAGLSINIDMGSGSGSRTNVGLGSSLAAIDGPMVVVSTGDANTLVIDGSNDAGGGTGTLDNLSGNGSAPFELTGLSPAAIEYGSGIATVDILGSSDTLNVLETGSSALNLRGSGTVNFSAQGLTPTVTAGGSAGEAVIGLAGHGNVDTTGYGNVDITNVAAPVITPGSAIEVSLQVGEEVSGLPVAQFTMPAPAIGGVAAGLPAGDFTATIGWGDGTPTVAGTIGAEPLNSGVYSITGSHTFVAAGNFTVSSAINFSGGTYSSSLNGVSVAVTLPATGPTAGASATYSVSPTTTGLTFAKQPTKVVAGAALGPIVVDVRNLLGKINTADTSNVTLSIASGPSGSLGGTVTVAAVKGIATFNNLTIDAAGTYTLAASDNGATIISKQLTVSAAGVASLVVSAPPASISAGAVMSSGITVNAYDAFGNPVAQGQVKMSVSTGPAGGKLGGFVTAPIRNGIAIFDRLALRTAGTYTLEATSRGISATSAGFTVTPAAAAVVIFQQLAGRISAGSPVASSIVVAVKDRYGNLATNSAGTVTLALAANRHGITLGGTSSVALTGGLATFNNVGLTTAGRFTLVTVFDGLVGRHGIVVV